ncbi:hypothetical protein [Nostoc sp.]|uniref:hypothetical protein n=1 Tax=Nostoc sp. TaxID=1180 RepID=UPI002FF855BF
MSNDKPFGFGGEAPSPKGRRYANVATACANAIDGDRLLCERLRQRGASRREDCDSLTATRLRLSVFIDNGLRSLIYRQ